jgi:hypothetical protein
MNINFIDYINITLVLLAFGISTYLLLRLTTWLYKFRKWQKQIAKTKDSQNSASVKRNSTRFYIPDIMVNDLDERIFRLHELISSRNYSLLVFLNASCVHCSVNFEEFFSSSKHKEIKYFVLFQQEDRSIAKNFQEVYQNSIDVYLVDKELVNTLKISFFPAFITFNKNFSVTQATPIPYKAINSFKAINI